MEADLKDFPSTQRPFTQNPREIATCDELSLRSKGLQRRVEADPRTTTTRLLDALDLREWVLAMNLHSKAFRCAG
jgi:hypothetical protein